MSIDDLAKQGRKTDTVMGHLTNGELVVPRELLEDADLKQALSNAFGAAEVDMEAYIVGSKSNSINPETGYPEFFIKKVIKKTTKFVRKAGRSARKAFVPDKVDKAVFGTVANVDDVVRGETPDAAAQAQRVQRAAEGRQIKRLETQRKKAEQEVKKAQAAMGRQVSSTLRGRRASRRTLMTADRLGPKAAQGGQQTLG